MPGHLTLEERDRLSQLLNRGAPQKEIALSLGAAPRPSVVSCDGIGRTASTMLGKRSGKPNGVEASVRLSAKWTPPS